MTKTASNIVAALMCLLGAMLYAPIARADLTRYMDSAGNCFTIGMATWNYAGSTANRATLCYRTTAGVEEFAYLRTTGFGGGGLNDNVNLEALGGADYGGFVPTDDWTAPTNCDCGLGAGAWDKLLYNGFFMDVYGQDGNDIIEIVAAGGTGDSIAWCGAGDDYAYNDSTVGDCIGEDGNDHLVSTATSGASDGLGGDAGNDCLWDQSGMKAYCDCSEGAPDNDWRHSSHTCSNCESTTECCGVC